MRYCEVPAELVVVYLIILNPCFVPTDAPVTVAVPPFNPAALEHSHNLHHQH